MKIIIALFLTSFYASANNPNIKVTCQVQCTATGHTVLDVITSNNSQEMDEFRINCNWLFSNYQPGFGIIKLISQPNLEYGIYCGSSLRSSACMVKERATFYSDIVEGRTLKEARAKARKNCEAKYPGYQNQCQAGDGWTRRTVSQFSNYSCYQIKQ